jgi:glutaredoxin 3
MNQGLEQKGIVTMYKKETCPYCKKAKELLEGKYKLNVKYVDVESDKKEDILLQMRNFSGGRNTVPQIFFNSKHLGGNDDVQKLDAEGLLEKEVETVRKTPVTMMMDNWYHPWY